MNIMSSVMSTLIARKNIRISDEVISESSSSVVFLDDPSSIKPFGYTTDFKYENISENDADDDEILRVQEDEEKEKQGGGEVEHIDEPQNNGFESGGNGDEGEHGYLSESNGGEAEYRSENYDDGVEHNVDGASISEDMDTNESSLQMKPLVKQIEAINNKELGIKMRKRISLEKR
uniref:Uncharacterized protein LOC114346842 isoform X2 n=1 Tax=Diabrotica virgifera virgifera TaxID=50390 RepID=A0A6P7H6M8_DIAVI